MLQQKKSQSMSATRRMVLTAVFAALAFATMFVFRFNVSFLTFDLKDAVITIAGLLLGPVAALTISLLVAVLEWITIGDTGWYGFIMNFASTATFSVVCSLVYTYRKKLSGAILGLVGSVVSMTAVMMLMNLVVTPFYMGVTAADVAAMIPTLFLPFNLTKATVNAALVLILYKPVSRAMQAAKLLPRTAAVTAAFAGAVAEHTAPEPKKKRLWVSIAVTAAGIALLTVAIIVFSIVLDGEFSLF